MLSCMAFRDARMTGGIVLKLLAARRPNGIWLVVLPVVALCIGVAGLRPAWVTSRLGAMFPFFEADEFAAERDQLLFFKAALGRIDAELYGRSNASQSLRTERQAVLLRMREVANRMPVERIPPEFRALLQPEAAPARVGSAAAPQLPSPIRLQVGLTPRPARLDLSSLEVDPLPPLPLIIERRRAEHGHAPSKADRPAADRASADRPKVEHPDRGERGSAEAVAADRPKADRPKSRGEPAESGASGPDRSEKQPTSR
jgi:hypothetical protein